MRNEPRPWLLAGGAPTPNGRLHLGHLGGQFLKLDVLKRTHQRRGGKALLVCGIDAYDSTLSYVAAKQRSTEPELVLNHHEGMRRDLQIANITCDAFINYTDPAWATRFREQLARVDALVAPFKVEVEERIPFSARTGRPITGRWLRGGCPRCGRELQGLSCDPCSLCFSAEELKNPRPVEDDELEWGTVRNEFISIPSRELLAYLKTLALRAPLREFAESRIEGETYRTRWTSYEPWGIGTGVPGQVYFNRVLVTLVEQALFGEIARELLALPGNAFEPGSGAMVLQGYGIDNTGTLLVDAPALALATGRLRPYDRHLVSEFVLLDGEKMSTGRPHALWVEDIQRLPGLTSDGVRAYLLSLAHPGTQADVRVEPMRRFHEELEVKVTRPAAALVETARAGRNTIDSTIAERGAAFAGIQERCLECDEPDFPSLLPAAERWLAEAHSLPAAGRFTASAVLAALLWPVTPSLGERLWRDLGLPGHPVLPLPSTSR